MLEAVTRCPILTTSRSTSTPGVARIVGAAARGGAPAESVPAAHLRSADPSTQRAQVHGLQRVGKRIVFALEGDLFLVIHLMIAGRLHGSRRAGRGAAIVLAVLRVPQRPLVLTEAGASGGPRCTLFGRDGTERARAGGLDVLASEPRRVRRTRRCRRTTP